MKPVLLSILLCLVPLASNGDPIIHGSRIFSEVASRVIGNRELLTRLRVPPAISSPTTELHIAHLQNLLDGRRPSLNGTLRTAVAVDLLGLPTALIGQLERPYIPFPIDRGHWAERLLLENLSTRELPIGSELLGSIQQIHEGDHTIDVRRLRRSTTHALSATDQLLLHHLQDAHRPFFISDVTDHDTRALPESLKALYHQAQHERRQVHPEELRKITLTAEDRIAMLRGLSGEAQAKAFEWSFDYSILWPETDTELRARIESNAHEDLQRADLILAAHSFLKFINASFTRDANGQLIVPTHLRTKAGRGRILILTKYATALCMLGINLRLVEYGRSWTPNLTFTPDDAATLSSSSQAYIHRAISSGGLARMFRDVASINRVLTRNLTPPK